MVRLVLFGARSSMPNVSPDSLDAQIGILTHDQNRFFSRADRPLQKLKPIDLYGVLHPANLGLEYMGKPAESHARAWHAECFVSSHGVEARMRPLGRERLDLDARARCGRGPATTPSRHHVHVRTASGSLLCSPLTLAHDDTPGVHGPRRGRTGLEPTPPGGL